MADTGKVVQELLDPLDFFDVDEEAKAPAPPPDPNYHAYGYGGTRQIDNPEHARQMAALDEAFANLYGPDYLNQGSAIANQYHDAVRRIAAEQPMRITVDNTDIYAGQYDAGHSFLNDEAQRIRSTYSPAFQGMGDTHGQRAADFDLRAADFDGRSQYLDQRGQELLGRTQYLDSRGQQLEGRTNYLDSAASGVMRQGSDIYNAAWGQGPSAELDDSASRAALAQQMGYGGLLQTQYVDGSDPSAAAAQLQAGTDAAIASQHAMARSSGNPLSAYQAANNIATLQQQSANSAAQLRAQEQQALRGAIGQQQAAASSSAQSLAQQQYAAQRGNIDAENQRRLGLLGAAQGYGQLGGSLYGQATGAGSLAQGYYSQGSTAADLAKGYHTAATGAGELANQSYGVADTAYARQMQGYTGALGAESSALGYNSLGLNYGQTAEAIRVNQLGAAQNYDAAVRGDAARQQTLGIGISQQNADRAAQKEGAALSAVGGVIGAVV